MFHIRRLISPIASKKDYFLNQTKYFLSNQSLSNNLNQEQPLNLSESCVKRLKELQDSKQYLKVSVESGGCSGLNYKFSLEPKITEEDLVIEKEGSKLLVDKETLEFIKGATIDYYEELIRTGFRIINNPNSEQGCSCGSSFSIKI